MKILKELPWMKRAEDNDDFYYGHKPFACASAVIRIFNLPRTVQEVKFILSDTSGPDRWKIRTSGDNYIMVDDSRRERVFESLTEVLKNYGLLMNDTAFARFGHYKVYVEVWYR